VGFDDGFDEAQAEAEAALGTAAVAAEKALPNARDFFRRNAHAGIGDFDHGPAGFAARPDFNAATRAGVFEGIVEEVGEHLASANPIDRDFACVGNLEHNGDALFLGDILVEFDDFAEERGQIDGFTREFHHAGLGFGDIELRVEHGEDAIGFLNGIGEGFAELHYAVPRPLR
jgi:hypothetical protein